MENQEIKYVYDSYGIEFQKNMETLKESGINEEIENLAQLVVGLIRNKKFDRSQLEMYVTSHFQFEVMSEIIRYPDFCNHVNEVNKREE